MGKIDSLPKLAIVGNTRLTLDGMKAILKLLTHEISYVFGLKDENLAGKVNSVSLDDFCSDNQIVLDKSENWNNCFQFCHENDIELVVTLGDSRIVPKNIIDSFKVWLPFVEIKNIDVRKSDDVGNEGSLQLSAANSIYINITFNINRDPNTLESVSVTVGE